MPTLVDATVLSNLASVNSLDLLAPLGTSVYIASAVYEETQQGLEEGYSFLGAIDEALDAGLLHLVTLEDEEFPRYRAMPATLHRGEAMSLAIAMHRGWHFLTDDRAARKHAERLGVSYSGTLGVLLRAIRTGQLTVQEANTLLTGMIERAHYYAPVQDLRTLLNEDDS